MYPLTILILETLAIVWLFYQLHKHTSKVGNWLRAVVLMLLISHCGLLIFNRQENANARRLPSNFLYRGR
jgi:membrane-bound ClpP family serine protease